MDGYNQNQITVDIRSQLGIGYSLPDVPALLMIIRMVEKSVPS